jgi:hypothetical protein
VIIVARLVVMCCSLFATLVTLEAFQVQMLQINGLACAMVQLLNLDEDILLSNGFIEIVRIASGLTARIVLLLLDTLPNSVISFIFKIVSVSSLIFPLLPHVFDHLSIR